jgi:hypothetical protein
MLGRIILLNEVEVAPADDLYRKTSKMSECDFMADFQAGLPAQQVYQVANSNNHNPNLEKH